MMKQIHAIVTGKVQGVSYRYYTQKEAQKIGLMGWVKNLPTGQVELKAQGTEKQLEQLIKWCWQGSPFAIVENLKSDYIDVEEPFNNFTIRR